MRLLVPALVTAACLLAPRLAGAEPPAAGTAAPAARAVIVRVEILGPLLERADALRQVLAKDAAALAPGATPGKENRYFPDVGRCAMPDERPCTERHEPASQPLEAGAVATGPASQPSSAPASQRGRPQSAPALGRNPGTLCRVQQLLRRLSYRADVAAVPVPGGVAIRIQVEPRHMVRKIFVVGNWPLFEEEILRLVRFRASQPMPEGCALDEEIDVATRRITEFLARQGYFDGGVKILAWQSSGRYQVDLLIQLKLGRRYGVDGVAVEGNTALRPPDITRLFHHRAWYTLGITEEPFTTTQLKDDLRRVLKRYQAAGFPAVRVRSDFDPEHSIDRRRGEVRLGVHVHEGRHLELVFKGNQNLAAADLKAALTFDEAGSYDEYEIEDSARKLRDLYQSKGYFKAKVTWKRTRLGDRDLRVTFAIVEGPRLKVRGVDFLGNWSFSAATLRGIVQTRVYPWLGVIGLGEGGYITDEQLKQDEERLVKFYQAHGFRDVRVRGELNQGQQDPGALWVRFNVDEGPQVIVDRVEVAFVGPHERTAEQALRGLTLRPGVPFTQTAMRIDSAYLLRSYASGGYPFATLGAKLAEDPARHRVVVRWTIEEGSPVRVGQILVRGNFKTWRHVILNEIPLRTGDRFDIQKAEQAERNLRTLGLFRTVHLTWIGLEEKRTPVDLLVHVEERYDNLASLEVGGGFSTDTVAGTAAFANVTASQGNLLGLGYSLGLLGEFAYSFTLSTWSRHVAGNFADPRWFGRRLRLELGAYWRVEDTIRLGRLETYGTSASVSRELRPGLTVALRYDLKRVLRNENFIRLPGPLEDIQRVQVPTDIGAVGGALAFDRRDHPLAPTRGYRLSLSAQYASAYLGPALYGSGEEFVKIHAGAQGFVPLGGGVILTQGVRYDQGIPLGGASMLPKIERFYAGGDTTVRGFEQDRMWTELVRQTTPPLPNGATFLTFPQGGNIRVIQNLELVFPLWRKSILFGLPINGAVFIDSGLLTNSFDGFSLREIRHSAGVAFLRLATPVGALSFEFATPLNPRPGDIHPGDTWKSWPWDWPGRLHFNFGFVF
ncbi:MAG TPA: outer membrane protein assembly factor BamA [Polyangia bacterium]|jgi:outer membrane protein insertion porin family